METKENSIKLETAYFAGGCFWGVEHYFQSLKGVVSTIVGYMGGSLSNPTYEQVCTGKTGHAEVLEVIYNSIETSFEELAKLFFEIHDSTQLNRQGPDIGEQYRSAIFYTSDAQKETALNLIDILKSKGINAVTALLPSLEFWEAEDYHHKYYIYKGQKPYCLFRKIIF